LLLLLLLNPQVYEELEAAERHSEGGLPALASEVEEALGEALEDLQVRVGFRVQESKVLSCCMDFRASFQSQKGLRPGQ
jgi:hypothetical protein